MKVKSEPNEVIPEVCEGKFVFDISKRPIPKKLKFMLDYEDSRENKGTLEFYYFPNQKRFEEIK